MFFPSCGYRFMGSGSFPAGIKSVSIPILENRSSETGAENIFTSDLIYELTREKKVVLTNKGEADAILSGVIRSISTQTISRENSRSPLERRVTAILDLKLTGSDGRVLWSAIGISGHEAYDVLPEKLATEQNERDAISVLSKRLAERIYNRITEDF